MSSVFLIPNGHGMVYASHMFSLLEEQNIYFMYVQHATYNKSLLVQGVVLVLSLLGEIGDRCSCCCWWWWWSCESAKEDGPGHMDLSWV